MVDYLDGKKVIDAYRVYTEYLNSTIGDLVITPKTASSVNLGGGASGGSQVKNTTGTGFVVGDTSANTYGVLYASADQALMFGIISTDGRANHNLVICNTANYTSNFGLGTPSANPTLHIASATVPGVTTQRLTLSHEQTYGKVWSVLGPSLIGGAEGVKTQQVAGLSTDTTFNGETVTMTIETGASPAFGKPMYIAADGKLELADADGITTAPARFMALGASEGAQLVLMRGFVRDDSWNWTGIGGAAGNIYLDTTAGAMTQTAPSGSGDVVQLVGYAITADIMYFNPSQEYIVIT